MIDLLPQGAGFDYHAIVFGFYTSLRRLGLDVDIVPASARFDDRALVVVPTLAVVDDDFASRVAASAAAFVFGPRTGAKTSHFAVPDALPPGALARALPMRVWRVESLDAALAEPVLIGDERVGEATRWRDFVEPGPAVEIVARYADHRPAWLKHGRLHALTGCFDHALLRRILGDVAKDAGLHAQPLPEGLRLRRRGDVQFAFNFGLEAQAAPAPHDARFLLGGRTLPPAGVAAWKLG
jgi:beta-galactosidase